VPLQSFEIDGFKIVAALVCHPGPTVGYRITGDGVSMAYIPDHEPALGAHPFPDQSDWTSGFDLAAGVDLLIHDAQYSTAEYPRRVGWGHSALPQALVFAARAGVKRLVTFHHDPGRDDAALDRLIEEARSTTDLPFELIPGIEGANFEIGARSGTDSRARGAGGQLDATTRVAQPPQRP
jgi:ribonuclease BN (tRNA processing enzyme)